MVQGDAQALIPFFKPSSLGFWESKELHSSLNKILDSGVLTDGAYCQRFEEMVKRYYHVDHAFVAPNATIALDTLVKIINPQGIYSSAFTWKSLLGVFTGRQVMWLDIGRRTWLSDYPSGFIVKQNQLVIHNHTFGNIGEWLHSYEGALVYDGAQAFGAEISEFGDATVFGFAATKPITTGGEGGMIVTNNSSLAEKLEEQRHVHLRMTEIQAAAGLAYLRKLPEVQAKRREIWNYYNTHLPYPHQHAPLSHSNSVYGILVPERNKLVEKIKGKIEYRIYYEPLNRGLHTTEWVYSQILCIPSYAGCPYKEITELLTK